MWWCGDVMMWWCGDVRMWWCCDVMMLWCNDCGDVMMWWCGDAVDVMMWWCNGGGDFMWWYCDVMNIYFLLCHIFRFNGVWTSKLPLMKVLVVCRRHGRSITNMSLPPENVFWTHNMRVNNQAQLGVMRAYDPTVRHYCFALLHCQVSLLCYRWNPSLVGEFSFFCSLNLKLNPLRLFVEPPRVLYWSCMFGGSIIS